MEPTEAIDILRGTTSPASVLHPQIAADMGADALAAWEWVAGMKATVEPYGNQWTCWRVVYASKRQDIIRGYGHTPLEAVLDAIKKEATGGR